MLVWYCYSDAAKNFFAMVRIPDHACLVCHSGRCRCNQVFRVGNCGMGSAGHPGNIYDRYFYVPTPAVATRRMGRGCPGQTSTPN